MALTQPPTQYAKSGAVNVAYQVSGTGPIDMVLRQARFRTSASTGSDLIAFR